MGMMKKERVHQAFTIGKAGDLRFLVADLCPECFVVLLQRFQKLLIRSHELLTARQLSQR